MRNVSVRNHSIFVIKLVDNGEKLMNILYASNDGYSDFLGVSMYSLLENNKGVSEIVIYIFDNGISNRNKRKLQNEVERFNRKIVFINISDLEERIGFKVNASGYNITTLARLFVDDLLPVGVDKILYLDCDIIVNSNLEELWSTDLSGKSLAAAVEVYMPLDKKKRIGLGKEDPYYNAGMLLINRSFWHEKSLKEKFLAYYKENGGKLLYNDQDIINHCCKDSIIAVSHTYNFEPNVYYFPYSYLTKINSQFFDGTKEQYKEIINHPKIVHYLGDERPWVKGNQNPYSPLYFQYVSKSGWTLEHTIEGKQGYMLAYHILNVLTKIFPPIRTLVTGTIGINKFKWFGKQ